MHNTLRQLLDNSTDILCSINISGQFIWLNNYAKKLFGFQSRDYSSAFFIDQFNIKDHSSFQEVFQKIKSEQSNELKFQPQHSLHNGNIAPTWSIIWNEEEKLLYCLAKETNPLEKSANYHLLFDNSPCPKMIYSYETLQFLDVNDCALSTYGYTKKELLNSSLKDITDAAEFQKYTSVHKDLRQINESKYLGIFTHKKCNGSQLKIEMSGQHLLLNDEPSILLTCLDVTERVQKYDLAQLEHEIMENALEVETDLSHLFQYYIDCLRKIFPEMKASILKVKNDKVWSFVSSLPKSYSAAINGQSIGPKEGSCGTAAFLKKRIISSDISKDPLWSIYKSLALPLGLKACWSQPIFNSKKEVIATFANYYNSIRKPTAQELELFERSAAMIGIILENQANSQELQSKMEQFHYVHEATNDAIYDRDVNLDTIYWGKSFQSLFGYGLEEDSFPISKWKSLVHPKDLQRTLASINDFFDQPNELRWQAKYRFMRADGTYAFVEDKAFAIRNEKGDVIRMIGALSDISRNRLEDLKKEVITEFSHIFNRNIDLKLALERTTNLLMAYGGYSISEIWLTNSSKTELNLYAKSANEEGDVFYAFNAINTLKIGEGLAGMVWEQQQIVFWNYKNENESFIRKNAVLKANLKNLMGVPLIRNGEFIGVWICAESQEDSNTFDTTKKIGLEIAASLASEINRKQLEEGLSHIFQLAPDIICTLDCKGNFKKINTAGCELLEYSEEELLRMSYNQIEYSVNNGVISDSAQVFYDQGKTFRTENRYITKSGNILWLDWNCRASFEEGLIYAVAKDITEKKTLQNLLDNASTMAKVGSWELNPDNDLVFWSDITKEIFEADIDYVPTRADAVNHYKDDVKDMIDTIISQAIKKGTPWDVEFPIITFKGNEKWVRSIGKSEYANNRCTRLFGSFQDINTQKIIELKLQNTLIEKKDILDRINDAFFAVDRNFVVTYWNTTAEKVLQTPKETILGKNLWDVFKDAVDLPSYKYYNEALRTGEAIHFEDFYEPVNRWFDVSMYPSKTGLSVYFKDISEKKLAEKKIKITNLRLKEIAWHQSHSVRAPVARLMAIIDLIKHGNLSIAEKEEFFKDIINSTEEIDAIIRNISEKTKTINFNE